MRGLPLRFAIVALWATTPVSNLAAQETPGSAPAVTVAPGTDMRLRVFPDLDIRGELVGWDSDTLRLRNPGSGIVHVLPTLEIQQVRVARPRSRSRGALRGLLIGSIAGSLSIGVLALTSGSDSSCSFVCFSPGEAFLLGAMVGGVGGGGVGAAAGAAWPGERWEEVALRP